MVVHELATNSVKHGALSSDDGMLDLTGKTEEEELYLVWSETGGPPVEGRPEMTGFGSKLIMRSVNRQLGGALTYDWQQSGLVVTLVIPKKRLER